MPSDTKMEVFRLFQFADKEYATWGDGTATAAVVTGEWLVTVMPKFTESTVGRTIEELRAFVDYALKHDDTFDSRFLSGIMIPSCHEKIIATTDAKALLLTWGTLWVNTYDHKRESPRLKPGPYLLHSGVLSPAWRLYDDTANAFSLPLRYCQGSGSFVPLRIGSNIHCSRSIAVPSRLGNWAGTSLPLSDLRIAVKDIFDIFGLKKSLGSRDYLDLSQPALETAQAIQVLVNAGANVVGLTQMCAMVLLQHPTQCIDFPAPFNPRGDGYQSPTGGSSGQAAAVASYEWLDAAIGSDSTASGRLPAIANGCFAYRPSTGLVPCQGMWSGAPMMDTPCIFARSIDIMLRVTREWVQGNAGYHEDPGNLPTTLLFTTDPLGSEASPQKDIITAFLRDVERVLGIKAKQISVADAWETNPPSQAMGLSLSEYLNADVSTRTYVYSFWKMLQGFVSRFEAQKRRMPYMPPPHGIHVWDKARKVLPEEHRESMKQWNVFRNWLLDEILRVQHTNVLLVWPIVEVHARYRDEWPSPPSGDQEIWEPLLISPITGSPEIIVPVGEVSYNSRVSGRKERLPVCVSVMGKPRSDLELLKAVKVILEQSNRRTTVSTGSSMFASIRDIE